MKTLQKKKFKKPIKCIPVFKTEIKQLFETLH